MAAKKILTQIAEHSSMPGQLLSFFEARGTKGAECVAALRPRRLAQIGCELWKHHSSEAKASDLFRRGAAVRR